MSHQWGRCSTKGEANVAETWPFLKSHSTWIWQGFEKISLTRNHTSIRPGTTPILVCSTFSRPTISWPWSSLSIIFSNLTRSDPWLVARRFNSPIHGPPHCHVQDWPCTSTPLNQIQWYHWQVLTGRGTPKLVEKQSTAPATEQPVNGTASRTKMRQWEYTDGGEVTLTRSIPAASHVDGWRLTIFSSMFARSSSGKRLCEIPEMELECTRINSKNFTTNDSPWICFWGPWGLPNESQRPSK